MRPIARIIIFSFFVAPTGASACWEEAARRYSVSADLLYAIARVESRLDPFAVNNTHRKKTGTYDIGLMQINSANLRELARHGIKEPDLFNPCININVGAWILAQKFSHYGVNWEGVGAYNAGCTQLKGNDCRLARSNYAWKVYRELPAKRSGVATAHIEPTQLPPRAPKAGMTRFHPTIVAIKVSQ